MEYPASLSHPLFDCTARSSGLTNLCHALKMVDDHSAPPKRPPTVEVTVGGGRDASSATAKKESRTR